MSIRHLTTRWQALLSAATLAIAGIAVTAAPAMADDTVPQHHGEVTPDIVGGGTVTDEKPWIAALHNGSSFTCTASQISAEWVITAAHCVGDGNYNVRIGSLDRSSGGVVVDVAEIHNHPDYNWPDNDISLLRLSRPHHNAYAPMATEADLSLGQPSTIYGWGSEHSDWTGPLPEQLKYSNGNTTDAYCGVANVICMIGDGGVAGGDSGGPGFVASAVTGEPVLVGVCAVGHQPADTNWGGYTSIPANAGWINQVTGL